MTDKSSGQIAYEAYANSWNTADPDTVTDAWDDLVADAQTAWDDAFDAVGTAAAAASLAAKVTAAERSAIDNTALRTEITRLKGLMDIAGVSHFS